MDSLDLSNVKAEKGSTGMTRYNMLSGIGKTLRILELCLALFFLTWILTRLPFALRLSANYLRSPLFVFAISNAIIVALFAQSRRFSTDEHVAEPQHKEIRDTCPANDYPDLEKVNRLRQSEKVKGKNDSNKGLHGPNGKDGSTMERRELRRSETEKTPENLYPEDKLSNEEFQRTIEAFIAKQMRFLREESLPIFVETSPATNNHTTPSSASVGSNQ